MPISWASDPSFPFLLDPHFWDTWAQSIIRNWGVISHNNSEAQVLDFIRSTHTAGQQNNCPMVTSSLLNDKGDQL